MTMEFLFSGQYIEGRDMEIAFSFSGLTTVPCRFNLRRYPFGSQTCNICFWPDNAYLKSNYEMSFNSYYSLFHNKSTNYKGRKDLGEYHLLGISHSVQPNNKMVILSIKLQTLYGFHMLNSFTPSFLISVICYSTLFFAVTDFNERVMVSLTSLLVLAALFTQASETSVRTPYFKYLDIWFVVLIFFCFLVVIFNVLIHRICEWDGKRPRRQVLFGKVEGKGTEVESANSPGKFSSRKMVDHYNLLARFFFAGFFALFTMFYSLAAAEII